MILVVLFGMAAAWKWTPLANQIDIRKVSAWALGLRNNPARSVVILAAYVIGSLLLVLITILIIATAIVFGPILRFSRMLFRGGGDVCRGLFSRAGFCPADNRSQMEARGK